jgi:photosystem II stability/assembly factor-like uncharacterized protein
MDMVFRYLCAALATLVLAAAATTPALAAAARVPAASAAASSASAASAKWHSQHVPSGLADLHLQSVSCAKDGKHCMTGGIFCSVSGCGGLISFGILTTTNGGASWKKRSLPKNLGDIGPISCGSTTFCAAPVTKGPLGPNVKESLLATRNGGSSWTVVTAPNDDQVQDVSCPAAATCFGTSYLGSNGIIDKTTDGGKKWGATKAPAAGLTKISCSSVTHCIALAEDGSAFIYTTNGSSWHLVTAPGSPELGAISCSSQTACDAAGSNSSDTAHVVLATANGGKSWKTKSLPSALDEVAGIACGSARRCIVVGEVEVTSTSSNKAIFATTNGGSSWTKQSVPAGTDDMDGAWCSAKAYCLASGAYLTSSHGTITGVGPYLLAN